MSGLPQVSRSELGPTFGLTTWALKLDVTDCLVESCAQVRDPSYAFKHFATFSPLRICQTWPRDYEINFEAVLRAARSAVECDDYQGRGVGTEIGEE
jgi:hypothetical protein